MSSSSARPVDTSSAFAAVFSLENARAYEPETPKSMKILRSTANAAIKYLRKQFTSSTGLPLVDQVDLTVEECFVCPPFTYTSVDGRGQEGKVDVHADHCSFKWKEFLACAFQPDALAEILAQPVCRVTIEHTGEKATRHFVTGTDGGCSDATDWELRFWRTDSKVVCVTASMGGKVKHKVRDYAAGQLSGEGLPHGGQKFVGSPAVRKSGCAFLFGGMDEEEFILYLERRVQDEEGFKIKVKLSPDGYKLPKRMRMLLQALLWHDETVAPAVPSPFAQPAPAQPAPAAIAPAATVPKLCKAAPPMPPAQPAAQPMPAPPVAVQLKPAPPTPPLIAAPHHTAPKPPVQRKSAPPTPPKLPAQPTRAPPRPAGVFQPAAQDAPQDESAPAADEPRDGDGGDDWWSTPRGDAWRDRLEVLAKLGEQSHGAGSQSWEGGGYGWSGSTSWYDADWRGSRADRNSQDDRNSPTDYWNGGGDWNWSSDREWHRWH